MKRKQHPFMQIEENCAFMMQAWNVSFKGFMIPRQIGQGHIVRGHIGQGHIGRGQIGWGHIGWGRLIVIAPTKAYPGCPATIAGHRRRVRCRRHRHSGTRYFSPVPEHSGTGLGPLIPVLDWFRHRHFCSFRYRTDWMPSIPAFKKGVHPART